MKKVLSLMLALLMSASAASGVLADEAIADVEPIAAVEEEVAVAGQYDKAIEFLNNYGIYKGKSADDLGAEDAIERYQMALFVSRISTGWVDDEQWEDGPENWSEFDDISEGPVANYWGALSYANGKGIIEGYGNGKFGPTDGIKYEDALTMVVRTLGYQGLDYPWGYIEKAVNLGLTDGITGVAYQDALTRGEVAQIIYNALFAQTKDGSTLGLKSFDIEFGWEKVIITASDLNIFTKDNEKADKVLESNNSYNEWDADSKRPDDGYVTFQLLNDDGTLADDIYTVKASEFGLGGDNAHDDEAVVGDAYYVLFEKDADSELTKVVAYESLLVDTLVNEGKTDDEGEAQDYAIEDFKAEYTLVTKYSDKSYVNTTKTGKPEVIVYNAVGGISVEEIAGNHIAIDWETGDILEPVFDDEGEIEVDEDGKYVYDVAWYYNELLGNYYQYNFDKTGNVVGINYMTDAEFEAYYKTLNYTEVKNYKGFEQAISSITKSAYSTLKLFDTDLNGVADRGVYESYKLGKFEESTVWCGSCGANKASYKISAVNAFGNAVEAAKIYAGETLTTGAFNTIVEGTACSHIVDRAWFVEGYTPVEKVDEDGEFAGYETGYVIYNYDSETGAIKVVKNINDGSDEDSFVALGVVRAYNAKNGTVTIGDTQYSIANYDELEGNAFKYVTKNWKTRAQYTALLRDLFNQFVEYVVVDGELVAIRAKSATSSEVIIVDSYAGLSSDGYIVVNGYSSSDLEYDRFRIGSYNGWMKGDYYYYLTEAKAAASFSKGAIYAITSYDAENDVYYVELAGAFEGEQGDFNYVVDSDKVSLNAVTIESTNDGYMEYTNAKGEVTPVKMKDSDKYVIIPEVVEGRPYATVKVYEGKLGDNWSVTGDRINSTDPNNRTYVIVNATEINGFVDTYKSGLVLLLSDKYISASYNGTDAEDWYLLGATEVEVEVFNLYTGSEENVILPGTNIDLEVGHVYFTQDGVIVEDLGALSIANVITAALNGYADTDADTATYKFGSYEVTKIADLFDEKKIYAGAELNAFLGHATGKYRDVLDSKKVFVVEYEEDDDDYAITAVTKVDDAKAFNKVFDTEDYDSYKFYANYVYDIAGEDIVIYVSVVDGDFNYATSGDATSEFVSVDLDDAQILGEVIYNEKFEDGELVGMEVTGVKYYFDGEAVEGIHAKIIERGYAFGAAGDHWAEQYEVSYSIGDKKVNVVPTTIIYDSVVDAEYECNEADCEACDLVQAIVIEFEDAIALDVTVDEDGNYKYADDIHFIVTIKDATDGDTLFESEVMNHITDGEYYYEEVAGEGNATFEEYFGGFNNLGGIAGDTIIDALGKLLG